MWTKLSQSLEKRGVRTWRRKIMIVCLFRMGLDGPSVAKQRSIESCHISLFFGVGLKAPKKRGMSASV